MRCSQSGSPAGYLWDEDCAAMIVAVCVEGGMDGSLLPDVWQVYVGKYGLWLHGEALGLCYGGALLADDGIASEDEVC